jgi:hypothetical protein
MHYVEFCRMTAKAQKSFNAPKMAPQDMPINIFTQRKRLPVFQLLSSSNGHSITKDQFHFASFERMNSVSGDVTAQLPPPVVQQQQQRLQIRVATPPPKMPAHKSSPTSINNRLSFGSNDGSMRMAAQTAMKLNQQQYGYQQQQPVFNKKSPPSGRSVRPVPPSSDSVSCGSGFTSFCSIASSRSGGDDFDYLRGVEVNGVDDCDSELSGDEGHHRSICM